LKSVALLGVPASPFAKRLRASAANHDVVSGCSIVSMARGLHVAAMDVKQQQNCAGDSATGKQSPIGLQRRVLFGVQRTQWPTE